MPGRRPAPVGSDAAAEQRLARRDLVTVGGQQQPAKDIQQQAESRRRRQDGETRPGTAPGRRRRPGPSRRRRRRSCGRSRIDVGAAPTSLRRRAPGSRRCVRDCVSLMVRAARWTPFDTIGDHPGLSIQGQPLYRRPRPCDPGEVKSMPTLTTAARRTANRCPRGGRRSAQAPVGAGRPRRATGFPAAAGGVPRRAPAESPPAGPRRSTRRWPPIRCHRRSRRFTPDGIPKLTRRREGSILGGVAGGIADHLQVPVLWVRADLRAAGDDGRRGRHGLRVVVDLRPAAPAPGRAGHRCRPARSSGGRPTGSPRSGVALLIVATALGFGQG